MGRNFRKIKEIGQICCRKSPPPPPTANAEPVAKVLRHEGPRALWRGLTPTFLRNTINQATNQLVKPLFDSNV